MSQTQTRKKNFSISMQPKVIERLNKSVDELSKETGFPVSRNSLIEKAVIKFLDEQEKKYSKE